MHISVYLWSNYIVHEHLSIIIHLHKYCTYLGYTVSHIEDCPTIQQLVEVTRIEHIEIATKWYELGLELVEGFKLLKEIEADNPCNTSK